MGLGPEATKHTLAKPNNAPEDTLNSQSGCGRLMDNRWLLQEGCYDVEFKARYGTKLSTKYSRSTTVTVQLEERMPSQSVDYSKQPHGINHEKQLSRSPHHKSGRNLPRESSANGRICTMPKATMRAACEILVQ